MEWEAFWTRLEQRWIAWSEARGGFEVVCPASLSGSCAVDRVWDRQDGEVRSGGVLEREGLACLPIRGRCGSNEEYDTYTDDAIATDEGERESRKGRIERHEGSRGKKGTGLLV